MNYVPNVNILKMLQPLNKAKSQELMPFIRVWGCWPGLEFCCHDRMWLYQPFYFVTPVMAGMTWDHVCPHTEE